MHEAEILVERLFTVDFREEAHSIYIPFLRDIDSADIRDGREDVSKVSYPVACLSADLVTPGDDQRHVGSSVVRSSLSSPHPAAVLLFRDYAGRGTVVGREDEYGIVVSDEDAVKIVTVEDILTLFNN